MAQTVKNPPAVWEGRVQSLGWEDPLEKETATHTSVFAWRIPWTEEPGRLHSMGSQRVGHDRVTNTHTHINKYYILIGFLGKDNGTPLQYSCLENPMDGGTW